MRQIFFQKRKNHKLSDLVKNKSDDLIKLALSWAESPVRAEVRDPESNRWQHTLFLMLCNDVAF